MVLNLSNVFNDLLTDTHSLTVNTFKAVHSTRSICYVMGKNIILPSQSTFLTFVLITLQRVVGT